MFIIDDVGDLLALLDDLRPFDDDVAARDIEKASKEDAHAEGHDDEEARVFELEARVDQQVADAPLVPSRGCGGEIRGSHAGARDGHRAPLPGRMAIFWREPRRGVAADVPA